MLGLVHSSGAHNIESAERRIGLGQIIRKVKISWIYVFICSFISQHEKSSSALLFTVNNADFVFLIGNRGAVQHMMTIQDLGGWLMGLLALICPKYLKTSSTWFSNLLVWL